MVLMVTALLPSVSEAGRFERFYGTLGVSFFDSAEASGDIDQESEGRSVQLSLGRYLSERDRVSLEAAYSETDSSSEFAAPFPYAQTFHVASLSASVNAYRTFYRRGRLSFYAGAGAGFVDARIRQDFTYAQPALSWSVKDSYRRFSYNVSLNGSYRLTPRLALQAGYRVNRTTGNRNVNQNTLSLSIRLSMAPRAVPKDRPAPGS